MSGRRFFWLAGLGSALAILLMAAAGYLVISREAREGVLKHPDKIVLAAQAFARDEKAAGHRVPDSVALGVLVRGGYLKAEDVKALDGSEATIWLKTSEALPQQPLMQVKMPDGNYVMLLADGSVQQLSAARVDAGNPRTR